MKVLPGDATLVQVAGLAKTEAPGLEDEVAALAAGLGTELDSEERST